MGRSPLWILLELSGTESITAMLPYLSTIVKRHRVNHSICRWYTTREKESSQKPTDLNPERPVGFCVDTGYKLDWIQSAASEKQRRICNDCSPKRILVWDKCHGAEKLKRVVKSLVYSVIPVEQHESELELWTSDKFNPSDQVLDEYLNVSISLSAILTILLNY